ncbi:WD-40 repeat protein, partial [Reticulomyxa filosa]
DIRSGKQIQLFNGHTSAVYDVEYSPFVIKNSIGNSNVICSGSNDNTIRFWDIRSNKNQLYMIKGNEGDNGILCFKFILLKKKEKAKNITFDLNLCYGLGNGLIVFGDNLFLLNKKRNFFLKSLIKRKVKRY